MTYIATGTLMRVPTSDIAVSHPLSRVREPLLSCHSLMSCVLVSCVLVSCADTTILAAHNAPAVTALMMSRFIFVLYGRLPCGNRIFVMWLGENGCSLISGLFVQ